MARPLTQSQQVIAYLQNRFGSAQWSNWQAIRKQFYSFVQYSSAGASVYTFFGDALGANSTNAQLTNMPKGGSFGQNHMLVKAIRMAWYIDNPQMEAYDGTDATSLYYDLINGIFQAGVLEITVGSRIIAQIPKPFLYAPSGVGEVELYPEGVAALTLTEGTPNTLLALVTPAPFARLLNRKETQYIMDPNLLIEAEQNFQVQLKYDAGALAYLATTVVNDSTNKFYVGCQFDGILFRPLQ